MAQNFCTYPGEEETLGATSVILRTVARELREVDTIRVSTHTKTIHMNRLRTHPKRRSLHVLALNLDRDLVIAARHWGEGRLVGPGGQLR